LVKEADFEMKRLRRQNESGQAMVELALVLPVLVLILLAIIQLGLLYNHYVTITDAARAAARMAAVSRSAPDPVGAATQAARDSASDLDQTQLNVTVTPGLPWSNGGQVTVTTTYPYSINLLGVVVKSGTITSTTKERIE
jgi:Flp pilus assembly protein TadG